MTIESMQLGGYSIPREIPVVLDEQNIEYEILIRTAAVGGRMSRRAYNGIDAMKLRREGEALWRKVDACSVPSERDEAIVRSAAPGTLTAVVPNGVDTAFFTPGRPQGDADTMLFFGSFAYHPTWTRSRTSSSR